MDSAALVVALGGARANGQNSQVQSEGTEAGGHQHGFHSRTWLPMGSAASDLDGAAELAELGDAMSEAG